MIQPANTSSYTYTSTNVERVCKNCSHYEVCKYCNVINSVTGDLKKIVECKFFTYKFTGYGEITYVNNCPDGLHYKNSTGIEYVNEQMTISGDNEFHK